MQVTQRDRHSVGWNPEDPEVENIQLARMQATHMNSTFSWQESRGPTGTGHSAGWTAGDPQEQNIHVGGMQMTRRNRTLRLLESRKPRGSGH